MGSRGGGKNEFRIAKLYRVAKPDALQSRLDIGHMACSHERVAQRQLTEMERTVLSNRQLEEQREREITEALAQALGLSAQDLDQLDYTVDPQTGSDGTLHGYNIYFGDGADPEILGRIRGLVNGRWVRIGPVL